MSERSKARAALAGVLLVWAACAVVAAFAVTGFRVWSLAWWDWAWRFTLAAGYPPPVEVAAVAAAVVPAAWLWTLVPWRLDAGELGRAAWARWADLRWVGYGLGLRLMRVPRGGIVLGRWGGRYLVLRGWLSVMLFGPTGVGKTAGILIASILSMRDRSIVVNDPAGDIFTETAGARAELGPVYRLEWGEPGGQGFNSLARSVIPRDSAGRGTRMDLLAAVLVRDGGNAFFTESARSGIATMALFCVYEWESAGGDCGWADVLSFFSKLGVGAEDGQDNVRHGLVAAMERAREVGMPMRVIDGLSRLADYDQRTRANIFATMAAALRPWENENVASMTRRCDFDPRTLRGVVDDRGRRRPVSVYVVVAPALMEVFGPVTGLLLESCYAVLSEAKPTSKECGISMLLDELFFVPATKLVRNGPAILRKYRVNFVLGFQDRGQPVAVYGREAMSSFDQNTAVKVTLVTNHLETAQWVEKMVGNRTAVRTSRSAQQRDMKPADGSQGRTTAEEGRPLVAAQDVLSLGQGDQIVLVQGRAHRPVAARAPYYFKHWVFRRRMRPVPHGVAVAAPAAAAPAAVWAPPPPAPAAGGGNAKPPGKARPAKAAAKAKPKAPVST